MIPCNLMFTDKHRPHHLLQLHGPLLWVLRKLLDTISSLPEILWLYQPHLEQLQHLHLLETYNIHMLFLVILSNCIFSSNHIFLPNLCCCVPFIAKSDIAFYCIAVSEGRGHARGEVGIAVIDIKRPRLILCQLSDRQTYVNTLTKISVFQPVEVNICSQKSLLFYDNFLLTFSLFL